MFNIKDLLQITRQQKIVISVVLVSTTVLLTAYLVYLFVRDLNSPLVPVVSPAVQYLWVVLSGWGGLLLIGQGDSPRRIASLADEFLEKIFAAIEADQNTPFEVDLQNQKFTICATGESANFTINPYKKHCLTNGLDDIDYLISMKDEIAAFEAK